MINTQLFTGTGFTNTKLNNELYSVISSKQYIFTLFCLFLVILIEVSEIIHSLLENDTYIIDHILSNVIYLILIFALKLILGSYYLIRFRSLNTNCKLAITIVIYFMVILYNIYSYVNLKLHSDNYDTNHFFSHFYQSSILLTTLIDCICFNVFLLKDYYFIQLIYYMLKIKSYIYMSTIVMIKAREIVIYCILITVINKFHILI